MYLLLVAVASVVIIRPGLFLTLWGVEGCHAGVSFSWEGGGGGGFLLALSLDVFKNGFKNFAVWNCMFIVEVV